MNISVSDRSIRVFWAICNHTWPYTFNYYDRPLQPLRTVFDIFRDFSLRPNNSSSIFDTIWITSSHIFQIKGRKWAWNVKNFNLWIFAGRLKFPKTNVKYWKATNAFPYPKMFAPHFFVFSVGFTNISWLDHFFIFGQFLHFKPLVCHTMIFFISKMFMKRSFFHNFE